MKTLAIVTNKNKDKDGAVTKKIAGILKEKYTVLFDSDYTEKDAMEMYRLADFIIVIGGDGTLLSAASKAAEEDTPILGINLGNLGFMADVERDYIDEALDKFLRGEYSIDSRFMIDAYLSKESGSSERILALNDIVVTRASYQRMVAFDVKVNGDHLASYQGDGLVISTPTGSTAYSMSAGGPIVDPKLDVCIITPVCPHTMSSKPVIVPGNAKIEITFKSTFDDMAMLTADGKNGIRLGEGDTISIQGSGTKAKLIKLSGHSFYEILNRKLQG